jgi:hypothetical protein
MRGTVETSSVLRVLRVSHKHPSRAEGDWKEPSLEAGQLAPMIISASCQPKLVRTVNGRVTKGR